VRKKGLEREKRRFVLKKGKKMSVLVKKKLTLGGKNWHVLISEKFFEVLKFDFLVIVD